MSDDRPVPPRDDAVGLVTGTEAATPLEFWVSVNPERYLQLDDVVTLERRLPGGDQTVRMSGVVSQVQAVHEGATFSSDVFLIDEGRLPANVAETALVSTTRCEPEVFVPPLPGTPVWVAHGAERDHALFFDQMAARLPIGLTRSDEPVHLDAEFLDGTRGAHVNISGVSGVATKTSFATFLLYSLFHSEVLGPDSLNTKALVFNVKGEDLLFLDRRNSELTPDDAERYAALGLPVGPFASVAVLAPPRPGDVNAAPMVSSRTDSVRSFFWTIAEFCRDGMLPFLFAGAEDERNQYSIVVGNVTARLRDLPAQADGSVLVNSVPVRSFAQLVDRIEEHVLTADGTVGDWAGRAIATGTVNAFVRRLHGAVDAVAPLVRADVTRTEEQRLSFDGAQVTVVDLHNLNDRAQRFVVGVVLRTAFRRKEEAGVARPLQFVVLDELNKYAPRDGSSPIKDILLDVAERGRSLGIVLIGAQQTASEVERRIVSNSAIRVVGRLDAAEAGRNEYGFLTPVQRQRATIIKPGTMIVAQPRLPVPLVIEFPFPAWATRSSEARPSAATVGEIVDVWAAVDDDQRIR